MKAHEVRTAAREGRTARRLFSAALMSDTKWRKLFGNAPALPTVAPATAAGVCDAAAAERLVGQTPPREAEARRLTGATAVRLIAPGQPVTQDFSERRVTIVTNPATGRVVRAGCG